MSMTRHYLAPWLELEQLGERLARRGNGFAPGSGAARGADGAWIPPVSIEETQDALLLTAELPGMAADQVELDVEKNVLTIRGEKREARSEEGEGRRYHLWERSHGSFARAFTLPRGVNTDEISAEFDNGLLVIRVPKVPGARSRKIEISGAGQKVRALSEGDAEAR
jgi:HSP20 family protein